MRESLVLLFAGAVLSACQSEASGSLRHGRENVRRSILLNHGIAVGTNVARLSVSCSDGRQRVLGERPAAQLVTLSTPGDCPECDRHWVGIDRIYREHALRLEQFVVTFAPQAARVEVLARYRGWTMLPLCFDENGSLWSKYNISHTPVTLLLRDGKVQYLDDAPLETTEDLRSFRDTLRHLLQK